MLPGETILSGAPRLPGVSEFIVMRSAAGWYIGTEYADPELGGAIVPYSRESIYFSSEKEAEVALTSWSGDDPEYWGART